MPRRATLALALACLAVTLAGCGGSDDGERPAFAAVGEEPATVTLAAPTTTAAPGATATATATSTPAAAGDPRVTATGTGRYVVAKLTARTQLRSAPGGRVRATLGRKTEFGSARVLSVVGARDGWLQVLAPELPNHRRGWIPATSATLSRTDVSMVVDRSARELRLRVGAKTVRRVTVAVGKPGHETPLGRFAVTDRLRTTNAASPYGCCAIALTGHQTKLVPGWPGGDRLAVHGTPHPETIGQAASLGCLRARKEDLEELLRRLPLGAPVFIRA